ncbi:hypothetical protein JL101_025295 [Skermanella rosea]|uniref:hypothetical protein n=1 Tax=Skermanella rosea TaxID=1817965 RepID=UPI00193460C1|nr:hypothetical protein [Skermanella rosea]UEM03246.1 hypothetical protein JL101_025295 [Skermanella rosea]
MSRDRFPERAVIRHRDGRRGTMVHGHRFPAGQAVIEFEIGSILADQIEAIVWTQDNGIGIAGLG